ncbi:ubiquinol-cytochrome C chaperone family protein [Tsuneonella mangrovi]|uniref:ubiquinol-cytochrome C chaperone family protein n=1 Tax=Tsuneonella mangrovi TaxID=1982042 RepID=UPI000BA28E3F|nr:ubiquinol-cytochrome C chaperone family protein [Tsuneonella mangrovi]
MSILSRLFARQPDPREALRPLWNAIVAEARRPSWYTSGGAEDTVSGRFDMVSAIYSLVLIHMEKDSELVPDTALLTELFVHDMDGQLREFGINDVVVGKRIGKLMGATGGRMAAYKAGLAGDNATLADAVRRNVTLREGADPAVIANGLRAFSERLERTSANLLCSGEIAA